MHFRKWKYIDLDSYFSDDMMAYLTDAYMRHLIGPYPIITYNNQTYQGCKSAHFSEQRWQPGVYSRMRSQHKPLTQLVVTF